jgi:carbon monoxide dehydrogenase subunit G
MLIYIAGGLAVAAGGFAAFVASRPDGFRYERSLVVAVTTDEAWAFMNNFRNFPKWSPWQKLDPGMTATHSGAPEGRGAVYEWNGNKQVGQGRMEITDTVPGERVVVDLHFLKPFEARNTTEWVCTPAPGGTRVTWVMYGKNNFMAKMFGVFVNMEKMLGKDFDEGLGNLKRALEG